MATVGKTFSDPDKWELSWFSRLPANFKMMYLFAWDRCDHAGVIEFVPVVWSALTGHQITQEILYEFLDAVNQSGQRLVLLDCGDKLWFPNYIRFNQQSDPNKSLSAKYSFHIHVVNRLKAHNLVDRVNKIDPILLKEFDDSGQPKPSAPNISKPSASLTEGLPKSTGRGKGKGEGQEQGKGEGQSKGRGHPLPNVEEIQTFPDKDSHPNAPRAQHNTPKNTPNSGPSSRQELAQNVLGYYKYKCSYTPAPEDVQLDADSFAELLRYLASKGSTNPQAKILTRIEKLSSELNGSAPPSPHEFVTNIIEEIENEI